MALLRAAIRRSPVRLVIALILTLACAPAPAWAEGAAEAGSTREYLVKAAFLFNFARFVDWPASAFPGHDTPIRIGILGQDPFGRAMEAIIQGETIHDRRLVVRRAEDAQDLLDCHLVFVPRFERDRSAAVIDALGDRPILTVGDFEGFAASGGVINFYLDDDKVRFEINPDAAKRQQLRIHAQLLALGRIVDPRDGDDTDDAGSQGGEDGRDGGASEPGDDRGDGEGSTP